jgi:transposase
MALELLAIDLGKRSFHLYGIDTDGVILSQKVSRAKLAEVVGKLAPKAIAMEACASAHYWARCWLAAGREVRLINPRFVKPFVKGSKNDAVDAEAIFEAALRPTMRFVPVKSTDQQDFQSLHRARDRLICQRTALINHTRGLLAEYGIVLPQGPWRFIGQAPDAIAGAELSDLARAIFRELLDQLDDLDRRIKKLDATGDAPFSLQRGPDCGAPPEAAALLQTRGCTTNPPSEPCEYRDSKSNSVFLGKCPEVLMK